MTYDYQVIFQTYKKGLIKNIYFEIHKKQHLIKEVTRKYKFKSNKTINIYLNPVMDFCIMASSLLLSNTNDKAATVDPQVKLNSSWSKEPGGACINVPSFVPPLRNNTYG